MSLLKNKFDEYFGLGRLELAESP